MKVKIDKCWRGGDNYSLRLTCAGFERLEIPLSPGEKLSNKVSKRALDAIEVNWPSVKRKNVRFV